MGMIVENPKDYFNQWIPQRSKLLMDLEAEARKEEIPIVGPVVGHMLYLLAKLNRAGRMVELGTATGYSAIFMGNACKSAQGRLTTFETVPEMARRATLNIDKAGLSQWVRVKCQDAIKGLKEMTSPVDMIFLDIEKSDYSRVLPLCRDILRTNGLLVADNTSFKDAHEFNRKIFSQPHWESVNLWTFLPGHSPELDGLCIGLKRS